MFRTQLLTITRVGQFDSNAFIKTYIVGVPVCYQTLYVVCDTVNTTVALRMGNIDITGFVGPSKFSVCWR